MISLRLAGWALVALLALGWAWGCSDGGGETGSPTSSILPGVEARLGYIALGDSLSVGVGASFPGANGGFGGNSVIADLNNDGWNDVFITDVDVDISGCGRTSDILRNNANPPNVTFTNDTGNIPDAPGEMLDGVHDVAIFDLNGDGWLDLVIGRCDTTEIWSFNPPFSMSFVYPNGLPQTILPDGTDSIVVEVAPVGGTVDSTSGEVFVSVDGGAFTSSAMAWQGSNTFEATLPAGNCTDIYSYYFRVEMQGGTQFVDPVGGEWAESLLRAARPLHNDLVYTRGGARVPLAARPPVPTEVTGAMASSLLLTALLLSRVGRFGSDAELTERAGDCNRAIERTVGAGVARSAEKDESVGPHGLDVVDRQRFLRSAKQAGLLGDFARFDEFTRHFSNLITLPMSRAVPFAFAQFECICTISGIHSAPPSGVAWLEPGWW